MHCNGVREHLNSLVDNEVTPLLRLRLQRHLKRCPVCATEYRAIQSIGQQAQQWRDITAPDALRQRVLGSLPHDAAPMSEIEWPGRSTGRYKSARWRFAAGLTALFLFYWVVVGRLDAQRVELLTPTGADSEALFAGTAPDEPPVAQSFAWRSETLASLLARGETVTTETSNEAKHGTQPTGVPAG